MSGVAGEAGGDGGEGILTGSGTGDEEIEVAGNVLVGVVHGTGQEGEGWRLFIIPTEPIGRKQGPVYLLLRSRPIPPRSRRMESEPLQGDHRRVPTDLWIQSLQLVLRNHTRLSVPAASAHPAA